MHRRRFMKVVGAGGVAAGLTLASGSPFGPRRAHALWGDYPEDDESLAAMVPEAKRAKNIFEIFCYGGLCPWETFYVVPEYGQPDDPQFPNEQYWTFQSGGNGINNVAVECGGDAAPELEYFADDENGAKVYLGPFIKPLRDRDDVKNRLRVIVQRHELEPHEAAIPYALSGRFLGNPKLSGTGAAVANYFNLRTEEVGPPPFGYVLYPTSGAFPTDNLRALSAVGVLPASSRPLSIRLEFGQQLGTALQRLTVGEARPQFDALVSHYSQQYVSRYTRPGALAPVRAPSLTDYTFSSDVLQNTAKLEALLPPEQLVLEGGSACGTSSGTDTPGLGIKLATYLLTREVGAPRYVCMVDGGLIPASGGGGYDTHTNHNVDSARNITNTLTHLMDNINQPGENDPNKLNLDETLIVLTTEFGRTPYPQGGGNGRNHHPYGYCQIMFGGPIGPEQKGLVGAIGPDSIATTWATSTETRAAMLAAMGIWPFEPELFAVGDVRAAYNEASGAQWLKDVVLGVTE